mgnify:CR=1 FL=1
MVATRIWRKGRPQIGDAMVWVAARNSFVSSVVCPRHLSRWFWVVFLVVIRLR